MSDHDTGPDDLTANSRNPLTTRPLPSLGLSIAVLLQSSVGYGPFALLVVVASALLAAWVALGYWVYWDGQRHDIDRSGEWAVASLVFAPAILGYLWERRRSGTDPADSGDASDESGAAPPGVTGRTATTADRLAATVLAAVAPAFLLGSVLSPPDPVTQIFFVAGALAFTAPLAYALVYRDYLGRREPVG